MVQIFEWVKEHGGEPIIPFSGVLESKLFDMPDDEKAAYLKEVLLRLAPSVDRYPPFCTLGILHAPTALTFCQRFSLQCFRTRGHAHNRTLFCSSVDTPLS